MRIEEHAMDHPKFIALTANAWRLWCEGGTYCQKHLTDGFIPRSALKGFRYYSPAAFKMLLEVLVPGKGPLWHQVEGGIQVHDYLQWNDPREKVLAERQKSRDRYERWKTAQDNKRNAAANAVGKAETTELNRTVHTKGAYAPRRTHALDEPAPVLEPWSVEAFDRFWAVYPRPENKRQAVQAWRDARLDVGTVAAILENVAERVRLGWALEPQFVALPARYLHERMWEDAFVPRTKPQAREAVRTVEDAEETSAWLADLRRSAGR